MDTESQKLNTRLIRHIEERAKTDKDVALALQKISNDTNNLSENMREWIVRLKEIEKDVIDMKPKVNLLVDDHRKRAENKSFWLREFLLKAAQIIGGLFIVILVAIGFINISK